MRRCQRGIAERDEGRKTGVTEVQIRKNSPRRSTHLCSFREDRKARDEFPILYSEFPLTPLSQETT